jgi:hypothetical protein
MRAFVVLLLLSSAADASAETLDLKKTLAKVKACDDANELAALGEVTSAESIGKRSADRVVHLVGTKARGYVIFGEDQCEVMPVVGKPIAFARGNFGNNATTAYALSGPRCTDDSRCNAVISLKSKDDKLVDLVVLASPCENGMTLAKRPVFAGRDSLELGCSTSGGADVGRTDYLFDAGSGSLVEMLVVNAGIGWMQLRDDGEPPNCSLKIPGGIKVVTVGAKPEIDVTSPATPEEAAAATIEFQSGGCDAIVATRRFVLDSTKTKFVAKPGPPRVTTKKKFCRCWKN